MSERVTRSELFMNVARIFATRSTCPRANVGAIIVHSNRIISTGYNGAPSGLPHCYDVGCKLSSEATSFSQGCERSVHAEANAIVHSAKWGISLQGSTIFTTHAPCVQCSLLILSSGIKEVVYSTPYRDSRGLELLRAQGIGLYSFGEDTWPQSLD